MGVSRAFAIAAGTTPLVTMLFLAACQPPYDAKTVSVRLQGSPPDAAVTVDDQRVGNLATVVRRGLAVQPGRHRVTVERDGYFPWDGVVTAKNALVRLDVVLTRIPE